MAYLLRFGQSGRSVDFATPITAPTSSFSLEYTVAITNTSQWQSIFFNNESLSTNTAGSFGSQRDAANSRVNVWFTLNDKARVIYTSPTNFTFNAPFTIKIEWSAATSQIRIFQNGTLLTTYSGYNKFNIAPINGISRNSFEGDLYAFKIVRDGVTYDWNTSASNGQGPSLIDTASGNNGVIVGGATYVFYNSVTTTGIPNNTLGAALNQPCAIDLNNYFTGATSYSVVSGSLPTGLSIVGNQIVGTPTSAQTTTLVIRASNSIDLLDSATITFNTGLWYCNFSGTGGFTSATLGNLITGSPKIKVVIKKFSLKGNDTRVAFWQGALSTGGGREFLFRRNSNVAYEVFIGGTQINVASLSEATTLFGDAFMTCNEFAVELDGTNLRLYKDGAVVKTVTGITRGTFRLNNALFRIGCAPASDTATDTTCATFAVADSTFGETQIYINDVLVRNYDPNTSGGVGNLLIERVSNKNGTQVGTWPSDNSEWVNYAPAGIPINVRALLIKLGLIHQVTDAEIGTNLKPLVLLDGQLKQRVASEGLPLIYDPTIRGLRTLASN